MASNIGECNNGRIIESGISGGMPKSGSSVAAGIINIVWRHGEKSGGGSSEMTAVAYQHVWRQQRHDVNGQTINQSAVVMTGISSRRNREGRHRRESEGEREKISDGNQAGSSCGRQIWSNVSWQWRVAAAAAAKISTA